MKNKKYTPFLSLRITLTSFCLLQRGNPRAPKRKNPEKAIPSTSKTVPPSPDVGCDEFDDDDDDVDEDVLDSPSRLKRA